MTKVVVILGGVLYGPFVKENEHDEAAWNWAEKRLEHMSAILITHEVSVIELHDPNEFPVVLNKEDTRVTIVIPEVED